jgi:glycopeptide antibiotics resistance protein
LALSSYKTLAHKFLTLPGDYFKLDKSFISDVIINLVGFIPFGFLLISFLPKKALLQKWFLIFIVVASVSFFVSLSIEYLQIYLPQRSSSAIDLIVNTLGGIIGIVLYYSTRTMITTLQK